MSTKRCASWAVGFLVAFLLGCNESPCPERPNPSPPSPSTIKKPDVRSDDPSLVSVTPKAAERLRQIIADEGLTGQPYLRLRVVPGSCQGYMHKLDLDLDVSAEDHVCESAGIRVVT